MVSTTILMCSGPTAPQSTAWASSPRIGGASAPVGISRGKICFAAATRAFASAGEITSACRSSAAVEEHDRSAAKPWVSISPA